MIGPRRWGFSRGSTARTDDDQAQLFAADHRGVYAVPDHRLTLAHADSEMSAIAAMRALVATAPGREDEIFIVEVDGHGNPVGPPRDIFDVS